MATKIQKVQKNLPTFDLKIEASLAEVPNFFASQEAYDLLCSRNARINMTVTVMGCYDDPHEPLVAIVYENVGYLLHLMWDEDKTIDINLFPRFEQMEVALYGSHVELENTLSSCFLEEDWLMPLVSSKVRSHTYSTKSYEFIEWVKNAINEGEEGGELC